MFARVENGVLVEWPIESIHARFPDISFPGDLTDNALPEGFVRVHMLPPPQKGVYEHLRQEPPRFEGGRWVQGYSTEPFSDEERAETDAIFAQRGALQRRQAYQTEADPLFFKWQRGESTQLEWTTKVAEIKARFP